MNRCLTGAAFVSWTLALRRWLPFTPHVTRPSDMPRGQPRPLRLPGSISHLRGSCHAPHTHLPAPCPCPPACPPARQPALYEFAGTPFPRERHVSCPETALQEVGRTKNGKSAFRTYWGSLVARSGRITGNPDRAYSLDSIDSLPRFARGYRLIFAPRLDLSHWLGLKTFG